LEIETVQDRDTVPTEDLEGYVIYQTALFAMILSDSERSFQPPDTSPGQRLENTAYIT